MSKSLSHYFLPGVGVAALAIGLGVAFANRDYGRTTIDRLEGRVEQVEANASAASTKADAEAARAAELEAKIAEVQAAAEARVASSSNLTAPAPASDGRYGLGREAHAEEIAAWDVDILPDGRGLPAGSGDVLTGEEVFADKCGSCHGDFAEGVDNWPVLAGGFDTLADKDPVKTVGSYWPHLSTAWDYISRSMPFGEAGTLTADETYAIVAYILYSNDLVDEEFELNQDNFAEFEMYNVNGFLVDDRPDLEYQAWRAEPCMENCKDSVEITMRATFLDVTPEDGGESVMNDATATDTPTFSATAATTTDAPAETDDAAPAGLDPALIAAGEKVYKKCSACHQVGDNAKNKTGPHLNGIMGRTAGSMEGFKYSPAMRTKGEEGLVWTAETMAAFLAKPKDYVPKTKMSFGGLKKQGDLDAIVAYLSSLGE